jgi:hypothetical protein
VNNSDPSINADSAASEVAGDGEQSVLVPEPAPKYDEFSE